MATDNKTITSSWVLMGTGPLSLTFVSGNIVWLYHAASIALTDEDYAPFSKEEKNRGYQGTEKTYAKLGEPASSTNTILSVTPIV